MKLFFKLFHRLISIDNSSESIHLLQFEKYRYIHQILFYYTLFTSNQSIISSLLSLSSHFSSLTLQPIVITSLSSLPTNKSTITNISLLPPTSSPPPPLSPPHPPPYYFPLPPSSRKEASAGCRVRATFSLYPTSSMSLQDETPFISNTTRTERIEHSFSRTPPVHKDKSKSVVAECVWEVFPDEVNSCFDFGLVVGAFLRIEL